MVKLKLIKISVNHSMMIFMLMIHLMLTLGTLSECLSKLDCVEIRRSRNDKAPNAVHFSSTIVDNSNILSSHPHVSFLMHTPQSGLSSHGSSSHVS